MPVAAASPFYLLLHLAPARLALAQGDKARAASHLAEQYETAAQAGWRYGQIETRLLQALAASDEPASVDYMADALVMGEQEGFVRSFLDKGEDLIPYLHLAASRNITPIYAQKLLQAFGSQPSKADQGAKPALHQDLVEPLSARELEILRLLAAGHTNQEIARTMIVSVNTVKSHLKNVYGKLGVNNRRAAVAQARVLGLIRSDGS
jgi:LuxR family maltose regulon positive regulatory protein